jgi:DNA-directed RNA polymerase subunit F
VTSHVYVLAHKNEPRIKIGKANDILERVRTLGLSMFDLERSFGLQVQSERDAFRIEGALHRFFDDWRLPKVDDTEGATEWFKADCRIDLEAFLDGSQHILHFTRVDVGALRKAELVASAAAEARRNALSAQHEASADDAQTTHLARIAQMHLASYAEKLRVAIDSLRARELILSVMPTSTGAMRMILLSQREALTKENTPDFLGFGPVKIGARQIPVVEGVSFRFGNEQGLALVDFAVPLEESSARHSLSALEEAAGPTLVLLRNCPTVQQLRDSGMIPEWASSAIAEVEQSDEEKRARRIRLAALLEHLLERRRSKKDMKTSSRNAQDVAAAMAVGDGLHARLVQWRSEGSLLGVVASRFGNLILILASDRHPLFLDPPDWSLSKIWFNEFGGQPLFDQVRYWARDGRRVEALRLFLPCDCPEPSSGGHLEQLSEIALEPALALMRGLPKLTSVYDSLPQWVQGAIEEMHKK